MREDTAPALPPDHADSHGHYHPHPTLFALRVAMAKEYGAKGIRLTTFSREAA
ncbi:MAG: hypothetical protein M0006_06925 [Magnetospirillum sp.]|nr:hypothetical protein [Magnetospirillum sp.]